MGGGRLATRLQGPVGDRRGRGGRQTVGWRSGSNPLADSSQTSFRAGPPRVEGQGPIATRSVGSVAALTVLMRVRNPAADRHLDDRSAATL